MAATGFGYLGSCFVTVDDAELAHCSGSYPIVGVDGGGPYVISCQAPAVGGLTLVRSDASGTGTPFAVATSYVACDPAVIGSAVITPELAREGFFAGFTGLLICYVVAFAAGQLLQMIDDRRHEEM